MLGWNTLLNIFLLNNKCYRWLLVKKPKMYKWNVAYLAGKIPFQKIMTILFTTNFHPL